MSDDNTSGSDPLDLRDLLSKPGSEYPDIPDLPAKKTFYGKLIGMTAGLSTQKGTPYFRFSVRLTDPGKDVTEAELAKIRDAGFSLADYNVHADFYLTKPAMVMFRRFQESLGLPANVRMDELWKLDPKTLNPTEETQELVRGRDVIVRTGEANDNGRVYQRLDQIAGVKREG